MPILKWNEWILTCSKLLIVIYSKTMVPPILTNLILAWVGVLLLWLYLSWALYNYWKDQKAKISSLSNVYNDFFIGKILQIFNLKAMILIYTKGFSWGKWPTFTKMWKNKFQPTNFLIFKSITKNIERLLCFYDFYIWYVTKFG
jgi:hypothetical protein